MGSEGCGSWVDGGEREEGEGEEGEGRGYVCGIWYVVA